MAQLLVHVTWSSALSWAAKRRFVRGVPFVLLLSPTHDRLIWAKCYTEGASLDSLQSVQFDHCIESFTAQSSIGQRIVTADIWVAPVDAEIREIMLVGTGVCIIACDDCVTNDPIELLHRYSWIIELLTHLPDVPWVVVSHSRHNTDFAKHMGAHHHIIPSTNVSSIRNMFDAALTLSMQAECDYLLMTRKRLLRLLLATPELQPTSRSEQIKQRWASNLHQLDLLCKDDRSFVSRIWTQFFRVRS
eukprot:c9959_g1_i2.p1 GENE.c9959_g1_i2~~c9959_g1_i2.p1  ORF type:complete len:246 (+),score=19.09 c9959_g1_i2:134-871(+)